MDEHLRRFPAPTFTAGILLLLALVAPVFCQTLTTGDIAGTVSDQTGAVVPSAKIVVRNLDSGDVRNGESNAEGAYRINLLKPGRYQITYSSAGLQADVSGVTVAVGQVRTIDVAMKPQQTREVVTVTETAALLQTENAQLAATYSPKQVELLPAPGGDITSVAFTVPGVVVSTGGGYGNFSSHGLPGTSNLFTTNGNDTMDPYLNLNNSGASNLTLGANEVQEASVIQNAYAAQYGRQAGAQVNFITKSGTNEFHGALNYNYNGSVLNANDFFANSSGTPRGRALSNQYGASLGGPIKKDKLFFFVDTEGLRYVLPSVQWVSLPSKALQDYVLKTVPAASASLYQKAFSVYNAAPGANRAIPVVNGDGNLQDSLGAMGCGMLADTPTGVGTNVFGVTTSCANAYSSSLSNQNSEWLLAMRGDYNISNNEKLFLRFKSDHGLQPTETSPLGSLYNAISNQPSYEGQINLTSVISPRLVNSFIGSSSWYSALFAQSDLNATLAGFPQEWLYYDGGANATGGMTQMGSSLDLFPQGRRVGQLQIIDDLSYTVGKHSFKAGVNYKYNRVTDTGNNRLLYGGRYIFYGLDEFANGAIDPASGSTYAQRFTPFAAVHLRMNNLGTYIQDDWAVSPQLKLTLGIRFDHTGNPSCTDNCFAAMNQPFASVNKGSAIPYNQTITTGKGNAFYDITSIAAQPRVGVVYNPSWSKATVVRGGIGLFTDNFPATIAGGMFGNAPNTYTPSLRTGTVAAGGAGSAPAIALATGQAFMNGFNGGSTLAQLQAALAPVAFTPPAYSTIPSTLLYPKYLQWSFEVERQITPKNVLTVSYAGNHGYDEFLRNANVNGNYSSSYPNFGGLPATSPDPRFRIITDTTNNGWSNYHGLSLSYKRGLGYGFQGTFSYTWSHSLDIISNGGLGEYFSAADSLTSQIDPFNVRRLNYSSSDYDIRHSFTADFIWEMPFKFNNPVLHGALGGWSIGTKWYLRSGTPFSVYNSTIRGRVSAALGGTILSDVIGPVNTSCDSSAVDTPCFKTSSFQTTTKQMDFGNLPRNSFRGPGYFDADVQILKSFSILGREKTPKLSVGMSAFNFFNHPNFANPSGNVAVGGLGQISSTVAAPTSPYGSFMGSAVSGRVVVLTGRLTF